MKKFIRMALIMLAGLAMAACGSISNTEKAASPAVESTSSASGYNVQKMNITENGKNLYGELYLSEGKEEYPLVILSHGFGGSHYDLQDYAQSFAENGIAAFVFDFTGGGYNSRSGGSMQDMSVLTEADDLNTVLDYFEDYEGIDHNHIFLLGASQGGFVSTYVAAERPQDVAGLIALYPAYVLQDDSRERNPDPENGPDTTSLMGMTIGRIYDIDAQSFDIYEKMKSYPGKALIIHGTSDSIVPVSYSERAAESFPDARLITIEGAGHGFYGSAEEQSIEDSLQFMKDVLNEIPEGDGKTMKMKINDAEVSVEWEDNASVDALRQLVKVHPLTIQMSMYGGFEQVGAIGKTIASNDVQTTTKAGDIVLYSSNQIVVFYGSNSWAYTRLGEITDKDADEMRQLLGSGDVVITISGE